MLLNVLVASPRAELPPTWNTHVRLYHTTNCVGCICCSSWPIACCINQRTNAVISCEQKHINSIFILYILVHKNIEYRYLLPGEVLILIGTGLFKSIPYRSAVVNLHAKRVDYNPDYSALLMQLCLYKILWQPIQYTVYCKPPMSSLWWH